MWDHVAVVAGTNSAGQKVIDAHTTDHYRVYWKLGTQRARSTECGRGVRAQWVRRVTLSRAPGTQVVAPRGPRRCRGA